MIDDSGLLNEFVLEANTHLSDIERGLLYMEQGAADEETLNGIFRAAHSIKGTAGFFELKNIVELAHSMENVFGELREKRVTKSKTLIDTLLAAVDMLKILLESPESSGTYDVTEHKSRLSRLTNGDTEDSISGDLSSIWEAWNQLTSGETLSTGMMTEEVILQTNNEAKKQNFQPPQRPKKEYGDDSVRVNVGLLNDLLTIAGEMVLRRNQLLRLFAAGEGTLQLETVVKNIDQLTTSLQKKVMQTRMQPIANLFNKFPRIVRDLSCKVEKEVDLTLDGLSVALDRSLIEALVDPMTHLVRNALDHGIEKPGVRREKNKPQNGNLTLSAFQENGRVVVDISDDGAGIDWEKVKKTALKKGLISKKEAAALRQADALNLIMRPGFSTSDKITDISGRGVGLDVVKNNIEKLGGKIEVFSEKKKGTTFRLLLPLTLAIIAAVIVMEKGQPFAIPQANVKELLLIQSGAKDDRRLETIHNQPMLYLRGSFLPLVRLGDILEEAAAAEKSLFSSFYEDKKPLRVIIVKAGLKEYGIVVDAVYDTEEILVKPNEDMVKNAGLYSGVTVLGDGKIAMILDTESQYIVQKLDFYEAPPAKQALQRICAEKQYLLLFKCSGSELLGLDLAMVSRVVEIDATKIKKVGTRYYFIFHGKTTRLIRPEYYLPLSRKKHQPCKAYVIIPKFVRYPMGILAEKIYDAAYTNVELENEGTAGKGLLGSTIIDDKLVALLNIYELLAEAAPEYLLHSRHTIIPDTQAKQHTVLLAEDTPFFLKVVKSYLEAAGYSVLTAENGREALALLTETSVDIVVSDIEMPEMTGTELVRAIRADERLCEVPVIALTSLRGENNRENGLRAGFDMYEYKLDRMRLLAGIQSLLLERGSKKR